VYLQQEFNQLGGHIEHVVSDDGGRSFRCPAVSPRAFDRGGSDLDHASIPAAAGGDHQSPATVQLSLPTVCILALRFSTVVSP
jgi:hypothetical protein